MVYASPRRPGSNPRTVHVRFGVHKAALGQVFLEVLRGYVSTIIILPTQHIHSSIIRGINIGFIRGHSSMENRMREKCDGARKLVIKH